MPSSLAHLWFIGTAIILMVLILLLPIGIAGALSFTDYSLWNTSANFVGTENYESIFQYSNY